MTEVSPRPKLQISMVVGNAVSCFGKASTISAALLLLVAVLFVLLWQISEWRTYISAIATGLAALLGAAAGLLGDKEKGRWLLAAAGGVLTYWVTSYTNNDLSEQVKTLASRSQHDRGVIQAQDARLSLLKNDAIAYLKPLPQSERDGVLIYLGIQARDRFNAVQAKSSFVSDDFEATKDILQIIRGLDANNGHYLSLEGSIEHSLPSLYPEKGRQQFYAYIDTRTSADGNGQTGYPPCRDNPSGHCQERAAYIFHLLANDFYQQGTAEKAAGKQAYRASFATALAYACSAICLFSMNGFNDPKQGIPTRALENLLRNELGKDCTTAPPKECKGGVQ